jgi:uncharacterized coiled-coil protein SlyX
MAENDKSPPSAPEAGELARLRQDLKTQHATSLHWEERALSAEAKLAETEKRLAEAREALRVVATQSRSEVDEPSSQLRDMIDAMREVAENALRSAAGE